MRVIRPLIGSAARKGVILSSLAPRGGLDGCHCAQAFPREFRDDVVRVARSRDGGVTIEQIAAELGVHPDPVELDASGRHRRWRRARREYRRVSGIGRAATPKSRAGAGDEVLRWAAAYLSQAICRESLYPLVSELVSDGILGVEDLAPGAGDAFHVHGLSAYLPPDQHDHVQRGQHGRTAA